jgi:DNA or RNA helicases of superfamily II
MSCDIADSIIKNKPKYVLNLLFEDIKVFYPLVPLAYSNKRRFLDLLFLLKPEQNNIIKEIRTNSILLNLPTGFGKTVITISLLAVGKTLVLVPRKLIYNQWIERIQEFAPNLDIEVKLQLSFFKHMTRDEVYECVVIDECHMNIDLVFGKILPRIKTNYLIGLTASRILENIYFDHYFKQTIYRHQTKSFSVTPIHLPFKPKLFYIWRKGKQTFHYTKILGFLIQNRERLEWIEEKIKCLFQQHPVQSLILAKNISTVDYLSKSLSSLATVDTLYGNKNSYDKSAEILLGTYQKMGVGFDTFTYKNLFLLDNLKDIIQAEGRLRNSDFHVYDFIDNHFLFQNHWIERSNWYRKRGAKIQC